MAEAPSPLVVASVYRFIQQRPSAWSDELSLSREQVQIVNVRYLMEHFPPYIRFSVFICILTLKDQYYSCFDKKV